MCERRYHQAYAIDLTTVRLDILKQQHPEVGRRKPCCVGAPTSTRAWSLAS